MVPLYSESFQRPEDMAAFKSKTPTTCFFFLGSPELTSAWNILNISRVQGEASRIIYLAILSIRPKSMKRS